MVLGERKWSAMSIRSEVRISGPLAAYGAGFARELRSRGYTDLSVGGQLRLMAHLSRWLAGQDLGPAALTPGRIDEFCVARRAAGYRGLRTVRAVAPLRDFLQTEGVYTPPPPRGPVDDRDRLLERYRGYLVDERGLVNDVVASYLQVAALFVAEYPGSSRGGPAVGSAEVAAFGARELPRRTGSSSAGSFASALRSFLRFLHVQGLVAAPLAQAVPPVADRKGAGLPRSVAPAVLARLLASCDRRSPLGRRDYAILLLLARLGLRAGEVARLWLDDIDWRAGDLLVRGKGARNERLPLPGDVGAAIAGYLQEGRPRAGTRAVFLRVIAPAVALTPRGVTWVVYAACDRAGVVPRVGAHRLRHTAATQMLRAGGSLIEVGQVLRHAVVGTTAIYAKVDFAALRPLAPCWPGSTR
jgi:site-specific recombinase XerD